MAVQVTLQCPSCSVPMETMAEGGDAGFAGFPGVAYCAQCRGTWCARGQLAELLGVNDQNAALVAGWRHEVALIEELGPACPVCMTEALRDVPFEADLSVKMLGCDTCHGAFVEAGTLPRIKFLVLRDVRSTRPPASSPSRSSR